MAELKGCTDTFVGIGNKRARRNDFIKTLLQEAEGPCWSLEISPGSEFRIELIEQVSPLFVAITWLGKANLEVPICDSPAIDLARRLTQCNFPVLIHICGRNISKTKMVDILDHLVESDVKNLLVLQGDWLHVVEKVDSKCDFPYASDLVLFIKVRYGDKFSVGVAGYPNGHPHSKSLEEDLKYLKLKVSNGADFIMTQAIFDSETLETFADNCKSHDINVPILAGVFMIKSYKSLANVAAYCNLKVPEEVLDYLKKYENDEVLLEEKAVALVSDIIMRCKTKPNLIPAVHVFSMNDIVHTQKILSRVKFE